MRHAAVILFCLLLAVAGTGAQPPNPRLTGSPLLRLWSAEDYGASPVNWRVAQHPRSGFLYASNNAGLLEFDGARWRLYPMPRGGAARGLAIDAAGRIWVGGIGEIARFEPAAEGGLHATDVTDQVAAGATGQEAAPEPEDDASPATAAGPAPLRGLGNLNRVTATAAGVFFRLPDSLAWFPPDGPARLVPAAGRFGQLFPLDGGLAAEHLELGLQRLDGGRLTPLPGAAGLRAFAARRDAAGALWLLTPRGPQRWNGAAPEPIPAETAALFREQEPTCAIFLADGRSAYGTTRSGVFVFDAAGRYERRIDRANGLRANRVNALAEDREGGLWLAQHAGLVRVQLDSPFALHGPAQGLPGGPRHVLRAGDRLYVTHGEGLAWRDDADGRFHPVSGFRTGSHRALAAPDGTVLVSAQGLHVIPPGGTVQLQPGPYLYDLHLWPGERPWLLASSALAIRFYRPDDRGGWAEQGQLETVAAGADDLLDTADGWLWIVTRTGEVWRADFRRGPRPDAPAQRYDAARGIPPALRRDRLRLLRLGDDILVASANHLLRYDAGTDRFAPDPRFPVGGEANAWMPPPRVGAPAGDAWFYFPGTQPRLAYLHAENGRWRSGTLPAPELASLVVNHLADDPVLHTLWIAGQGTLLSVDLDWRPDRPALAPAAVLRGISTPAGEPVTIGAEPLPPDRTALRFAFAAPVFAADYRGQGGTRYRTRLDGLDDAWTGWTAEAHRDFTNLPPGTFTLHIQARDFAGRVGPETTLAFGLAPPWWRTPVALAGWLLLGLAALGALAWWAARSQRTRAQRLEALVAARTRELRTSNEELARLHRLDLDEKAAAHLAAEKAQLEMLRYQLNPHFLFNALNSIHGFVFPHSREAATLVRHLADFCRQTLTRGRDEWHSLGEEFAMLATYLNIEQLRWRERLGVTVELAPDLAEAPIPPFLLLPLVENAIKHGGATSFDRLEVSLTAARGEAGAIVIRVANTGHWLAEDEPRNAPSAGIGLENLRARLERFFPHAHQLATGARDGWVTVELRLTPAGARPAAATTPPFGRASS